MSRATKTTPNDSCPPPKQKTGTILEQLRTRAKAAAVDVDNRGDDARRKKSQQKPFGKGKDNVSAAALRPISMLSIDEIGAAYNNWQDRKAEISRRYQKALCDHSHVDFTITRDHNRETVRLIALLARKVELIVADGDTYALEKLDEYLDRRVIDQINDLMTLPLDNAA